MFITSMLADQPDIQSTLPVIDLLNNGVVAYAPDNPEFPTLRGFEATPVTVGEGSVAIRKRGYAVDIYGLMHDINGPSDRVAWPRRGQTHQSPQCRDSRGGTERR
jgi:hypothetical protein